MIKLFSYACLAAAVTSSLQSFAAGRDISTTIKNASVSINAYGSEGSSGYLNVSVTNLSNKTQTVYITVVDEVVSTCLNITDANGGMGGNWSLSSATSMCNTQSLSPLASTKVILNVSSPSISISLGGFQSSWNPTNCQVVRLTVAPAASGLGKNPPDGNAVKYASVSYSFRILIHVDEDNGAIIASGSGSTGFSIFNTATQATVPVQFDFNGGRPF